MLWSFFRISGLKWNLKFQNKREIGIQYSLPILYLFRNKKGAIQIFLFRFSNRDIPQWEKKFQGWEYKSDQSSLFSFIYFILYLPSLSKEYKVDILCPIPASERMEKKWIRFLSAWTSAASRLFPHAAKNAETRGVRDSVASLRTSWRYARVTYSLTVGFGREFFLSPTPAGPARAKIRDIRPNSHFHKEFPFFFLTSINTFL